MKVANKLLICILVFIQCIALTGCASNKVVKYTIPSGLKCESACIAAENENYCLQWDDETCCLLLKNKVTNYIWSSVPYDAYCEGNTSSALNSALGIEYYDLTDSSTQTDKSYTCVSEGNISAELIKNGICVTYYFSVAEVTIPVKYTLKNEGIKISVEARDITESGKTKLTAISFAPYFCSVKNVEDKSAYLLIPAGSGALMYTDDEITKSSRNYSGEVYGNDASRFRLDVVENEEAIFAPVFGAKSADGNALFAVIDDGAEAARIDAASGSARYGYSNVYASFLVRGYDEIEQIIGSWRSDALALSETWSNDAVYSVSYYPLSGENADYSGMAKFYREYLIRNNEISSNADEQKAYCLNIIGGAHTKKFLLGVPYDSVAALTTCEEALSILKEAVDKTEQKPCVIMSGYGESGISIGKIAGGYTINNRLGGNSGISKIENYCSGNGIPVFTNFEILYYTKTGNGFSTMFDSAKTANLQSSGIYPLKVNIRLPDESQKKVHILNRKLLNKATDKLVKFTENKFSGIGLGALGTVAYSDYSDESTYMKAGTEKQVEKLISTVKNSGHSVLLNSANSYAAGIVDCICDVPLDNGNYASFDEAIPFYQCIFSGVTPLYSTAINYSADQRLALLKAVESGVSPQFILTKNNCVDLTDSAETYFYATNYESNIGNIASMVKETSGYFSAIKGLKIKSHFINDNGITKTVFENGLTVFVNYNNEAKIIENQTVEAMSFIYSNTSES